MKCVACKKDIPDFALFCPYCRNEHPRCSECGTVVWDKDAKYCYQCGAFFVKPQVDDDGWEEFFKDNPFDADDVEEKCADNPLKASAYNNVFENSAANISDCNSLDVQTKLFKELFAEDIICSGKILSEGDELQDRLGDPFYGRDKLNKPKTESELCQTSIKTKKFGTINAFTISPLTHDLYYAKKDAVYDENNRKLADIKNIISMISLCNYIICTCVSLENKGTEYEEYNQGDYGMEFIRYIVHLNTVVMDIRKRVKYTLVNKMSPIILIGEQQGTSENVYFGTISDNRICVIDFDKRTAKIIDNKTK